MKDKIVQTKNCPSCNGLESIKITHYINEKDIVSCIKICKKCNSKHKFDEDFKLIKYIK